MGFFSLKATCGVCGETIGLNRFKISKSDAWLCYKCLKKAGGPTSFDISKVTIEDIKQIIREKELDQQQKDLDYINNPLSTAEGMYKYCVDNDFGCGFTDKWGIKHFKIIENNLMDSEEVHMVFMGLHNYVSSSHHENNFAYAITNKRIMLAQKNALAGEIFQSISLKNINDITSKTGLAFGVITIDSSKETFSIGLSKSSANSVNSRIHEVLDEVNNNKTNTNDKPSSSSSMDSVADELKKLKELLDMDILTQEEFDSKKKQLLNL